VRAWGLARGHGRRPVPPQRQTGCSPRNVKEQQTRLGATPGLLEALAKLAFEEDADVRTIATRALGDLLCDHAVNVTLLERACDGLAKLADAAISAPRWLDAQSAAYAWTVPRVMRPRVWLLLAMPWRPPRGRGDALGLIAARLVRAARSVHEMGARCTWIPASWAKRGGLCGVRLGCLSVL